MGTREAATVLLLLAGLAAGRFVEWEDSRLAHGPRIGESLERQQSSRTELGRLRRQVVQQSASEQAGQTFSDWKEQDAIYLDKTESGELSQRGEESGQIGQHTLLQEGAGEISQESLNAQNSIPQDEIHVDDDQNSGKFGQESDQQQVAQDETPTQFEEFQDTEQNGINLEDSTEDTGNPREKLKVDEYDEIGLQQIDEGEIKVSELTDQDIAQNDSDLDGLQSLEPDEKGEGLTKETLEETEQQESEQEGLGQTGQKLEYAQTGSSKLNQEGEQLVDLESGKAEHQVVQQLDERPASLELNEDSVIPNSQQGEQSAEKELTGQQQVQQEQSGQQQVQQEQSGQQQVQQEQSGQQQVQQEQSGQQRGQQEQSGQLVHDWAQQDIPYRQWDDSEELSKESKESVEEGDQILLQEPIQKGEELIKEKLEEPEQQEARQDELQELEDVPLRSGKLNQEGEQSTDTEQNTAQQLNEKPEWQELDEDYVVPGSQQGEQTPDEETGQRTVQQLNEKPEWQELDEDYVVPGSQQGEQTPDQETGETERKNAQRENPDQKGQDVQHWIYDQGSEYEESREESEASLESRETLQQEEYGLAKQKPADKHVRGPEDILLITDKALQQRVASEFEEQETGQQGESDTVARETLDVRNPSVNSGIIQDSSYGEGKDKENLDSVPGRAASGQESLQQVSVESGYRNFPDTGVNEEYEEIYQEKGGIEEVASVDTDVEYVQAGEGETGPGRMSQDNGQEYVPIMSGESTEAEPLELERIERAEPPNADSQEPEPAREGQGTSEENKLEDELPEEKQDTIESLFEKTSQTTEGVDQEEEDEDGEGQRKVALEMAWQRRFRQFGARKAPSTQEQNGTRDIDEGQAGSGQTGSGQVGSGQVGSGQVGSGQIGSRQPGSAQAGNGEVEMGQVGLGRLGSGQAGSVQEESGQRGDGQTGEGQIGGGQAGSGRNESGPAGEEPQITRQNASVLCSRPAAMRPVPVVAGGQQGGAVGPAGGQGGEATEEDEFRPERTRDFHPFEWRLCAEAGDHALGNAAVSPLGARLVLGVLGEAASYGAAAEIRMALGLPRDPNRARSVYRSLITDLQQKGDGYLMDVGNRLYLDHRYDPLPEIAAAFSRIFETEIQKVDFKSPKLVRDEINTWVSNFTHGRIPNLLTNDQLLENSISLVLNVIYFKGRWQYPFSKNDTIPGLFHKTPNETVKVQYMRQTGDFYYLESNDLDAKILRLPYKGKKYSMFIILPKHPKNFDKLVQSLHPVIVRDQLLKMQKMEVDIKIPKIRIDCTIQMKEILQAIGIRRIFNVSREINLTKNKTDIMISQVFQKISLEVNEEGTVAAMATGSGLANTFGGRIEFKATHPFLFFVEEERTGTVLFIGKVIDPSITESVIDMEDTARLKRWSHWGNFHRSKSRKYNSDSASDSDSSSDSDSDSDSRSDERFVFDVRPAPPRRPVQPLFPTHIYRNPYHVYPSQGYPYLRIPERK